MYIVAVKELLHKERVEKFIEDWRKHVRYSLPEEIRKEIIAEKQVKSWYYIIVMYKSLASLFIIRRLEALAKKHRVKIDVYETKAVIIDESYIDEKLREKVEKIPPHLVHDIRKALVERRLPRGKQRKEILETMRY